MSGSALRLYPLPVRELAPERIYKALEVPPKEPGPRLRPYVIINMVSSLDGKAALQGRASSLGDDLDRRTMRTLRSKADAVMIGAGTLRAEKLSLALDEPAAQKRCQPLAVLISRTGDLPLENNLIVDDRQDVLVMTTQDAPRDLEDRFSGRARVLRLRPTPSGDIALGEALERLKGEHGVEVLHVEGGPMLNEALFSGHLADELFLTLAPKLLGGASTQRITILEGAARAPTDLKLLSVHLANSELFLRYARP